MCSNNKWCWPMVSVDAVKFQKDSLTEGNLSTSRCFCLLHRSGHQLTIWRAWGRSSWPPERPWPARPWSQIQSWVLLSHLWSGACALSCPCHLQYPCHGWGLDRFHPKASLEASYTAFEHALFDVPAHPRLLKSYVTTALLSAVSDLQSKHCPHVSIC